MVPKNYTQCKKLKPIAIIWFLTYMYCSNNKTKSQLHYSVHFLPSKGMLMLIIIYVIASVTFLMAKTRHNKITATNLSLQKGKAKRQLMMWKRLLLGEVSYIHTCVSFCCTIWSSSWSSWRGSLLLLLFLYQKVKCKVRIMSSSYCHYFYRVSSVKLMLKVQLPFA